MDTQAILKAGIAGLAGSLLMYILLQVSLITGIAPFNVTPSYAFVNALGFDIKALAIVLHFLYGAFWSIMLVLFYGDEVNFGRGMSLSIVVWILMMIAISPGIDWGFFGNGSNSLLEPDQMLYVAPGIKYPAFTLVIHLFYGLIVGWLNPNWAVRHIESEEEEALEK
ncbi:MAG: hypothetical protein K9J27_09435 [Bacteroidales bacterium]|nr:hypothetical protein [Bacteroidales bacterium]MCF8333916.1 hypothetical protein [Bacteroidales bacterium]